MLENCRSQWPVICVWLGVRLRAHCRQKRSSVEPMKSVSTIVGRWGLYLLCCASVGCGRDVELEPSVQLAEATRPTQAQTGQSAPVLPSDNGSGGLTSSPLSAIVKRPAGAPLFETLSADRTGVDFQLQLPEVEKHVREVIHLNVNGGICTGDFDGDGLTDFYVTSTHGGNRLYRNLGDFHFQDVTQDVGLDDKEFWGTGATFVDIDNDGDLDIYACGYRRPNRLYINERGESDNQVHFTEQAHRYGLAFDGASMTMAFADIDHDGDLDGYLATTALSPPPGTKFKVRFEGKKPVVLDELQEYWQLVYLPGDRAHRTESGQFDHLYRNDGQHFTEVTKQAGIDGPYFTLSATWWDYDDDGSPDLYVANDFMGPDFLYHNEGDGTFTDVAKENLPHIPWFSMGTDVADVNNDGRMDFLATDMSARTHYRESITRGNIAKADWFFEVADPRQYVRNALYINSGAGRMIEAAYLAGMASTDWTWNPRLADFDNDGRVDLYVTNGVVRDTMNTDLGDYADSHFAPGSPGWARFWAEQSMQKERNVALRNLGDLKFEDVGAAWGLDRTGVSFGAATADFDNDGDLDLVVNNADVPLSLYRNVGDEGHRVRIRLHGRVSNRFGIGAKIELVADGLRQTRYLTLARGWLSASEPVATFGLGDATTIDELTVTWPSGHQQKFADLKVDQLYTITEPSGRPSRERRTEPPDRAELPTAATPMFVAAEDVLNVEYREESFNDFAIQPLLPNRLSELGPAMAWADVDQDGDNDCFVGGPKGKPGRLFLNSAAGSFSQRPVPDFDEDRECEDTGAVFFDADGDGDQDLYVVSGSIEHKSGDTAYRDRLYLNDGGGQFQKAVEDVLPDLRDSGSVVAACDFDQDGDVDLFVGSRCLPGQYPLPPTSRLLVNTAGRFQDQTPEELLKAGMVTDAIWSDVDGDGWVDLIVTTDWGPVKVFANQHGKLVDRTGDTGLADRRGWWLAVAAGDLDHDGDTDFVVTNFGLNTKYDASPQKPERLNYGDFDGMGDSQIVEAATDGQSWYPRRDLSALRDAMPIAMTKYKTNEEFATATLAEIFTQDHLDQAKRLDVNTLESGVLINEGQFRFRFEALPTLAQIAPSLGVDVADVNGDGHLDVVMAQNFYGPQPETGRMDGGVGLLLVGDGRGNFEPVWPDRSGIVVPRDARKVRTVDLDADGRPDLVFAVQDGAWRVFLNHTSGWPTAANQGPDSSTTRSTPNHPTEQTAP